MSKADSQIREAMRIIDTYDALFPLVRQPGGAFEPVDKNNRPGNSQRAKHSLPGKLFMQKGDAQQHGDDWLEVDIDGHARSVQFAQGGVVGKEGDDRAGKR